MSTQWRIGAVGAVGLDYSVVPLVMRMIGIPVSERPGLFESLRTMEETALATMRENRSKT